MNSSHSRESTLIWTWRVDTRKKLIIIIKRGVESNSLLNRESLLFHPFAIIWGTTVIFSFKNVTAMIHLHFGGSLYFFSRSFQQISLKLLCTLKIIALCLSKFQFNIPESRSRSISFWTAMNSNRGSSKVRNFFTE